MELVVLHNLKFCDLLSSFQFNLGFWVRTWCTVSQVCISQLILVSSVPSAFLETTFMIQVESVFLDCSNTCCDSRDWDGIVCGKSTLAF